ncbi:inner membrane protein YbjM [Escherichia coli]|jgi:hypothetical protein|nr:hypothetical protein [Citrobacter sp. JUb117]STE17703.1 inner membrane protein YbjM [Escherichia coli]
MTIYAASLISLRFNGYKNRVSAFLAWNAERLYLTGRLWAKRVFDRECQEERLKHRQGWAGAICCFVLFIVVCLSLTLNVKGAFKAAGHPEVGLLFFILPGAAASFFSHRREVLRPLLGAMLAAPCCLLLMRFVFMPTRSLWQELAWLFSAVFWCALGALCFLFISSLFNQHQQRKKH